MPHLTAWMTLVRGAAALLLVAGALCWQAATAIAQTPACALTSAGAPQAAPGQPCWTDVSPYPFGYAGGPLDTSNSSCQALEAQNGPRACYLIATSLAFRAWNRGLAAVAPAAPTGSTTPYGVWLYNGVRWYPDPTFPGQAVCKGSTVLWAGKLDYWLVGQETYGEPQSWPALCRFDAANYAWEPMPIPKAALAHVPLDANGNLEGGAIEAGSCLAWDNCWFFGSYGVILHWDGLALTDATPDPSAPWLRSDYTSAIARTDQFGNPFGFAVAATSPGQASVASGSPTPTPATAAQPDGSPPPELFASNGGPFTPLSYSPPTTPVFADRFQTDLVAVDFGSSGAGWVAGDPRGERPGFDRRDASSEPAPLAPISRDGGSSSCPAVAAAGYEGPWHNYTGPWYLWSSLSVLPGGDALAGGQASNSASSAEPVIVRASCARAPAETRFRTSTGDAIDGGGYVTSLVGNASNDAWAAVSPNLQFPGDPTLPHIYRLTDGLPPDAPSGDDNEPRSVPVVNEPSLFVFAPPVQVPSPPPATTVTAQTRARRKTVHLAAAVYDLRTGKLVKLSNGMFKLTFTFRTRRKVTLGIEGLRHGKVVATSGLKTFTGRQGQLALVLDRKNWPTQLKLVLPKVRK